MDYIYLRLIIIYIIFSIYGCKNHTAQSEINLPDHIGQLENLIVISPSEQSPDTVEFKKETVFESNENVFMGGYISNIAIDDSERVYIGSSDVGRGGIYVFNSDGSYLNTIGRVGRGPGEFGGIGSLCME